MQQLQIKINNKRINIRIKFGSGGLTLKFTRKLHNLQSALFSFNRNLIIKYNSQNLLKSLVEGASVLGGIYDICFCSNILASDKASRTGYLRKLRSDTYSGKYLLENPAWTPTILAQGFLEFLEFLKASAGIVTKPDQYSFIPKILM
jgi:hypothetical protein